MRRGWKTIVGFALLGLAIAAICYAYAAFYDYEKPMNGFDLPLSPFLWFFVHRNYFSQPVSIAKSSGAAV
jgi:hypothetical protein